MLLQFYFIRSSQLLNVTDSYELKNIKITISFSTNSFSLGNGKTS